MASGDVDPSTSDGRGRKSRLDGDRQPTIVERHDYHPVPLVAKDGVVPSVSTPDMDSRMAAIEKMVMEISRSLQTPPPEDEWENGTNVPEENTVSDLDFGFADGQGDSDPLRDLAASVGAGLLGASGVTPTVSPCTDEPQVAQSDKDKLNEVALSMLKDTFGREDVGKAVFDELAEVLDKTLRYQPNHNLVQELLEKVPYPVNVPKLKVPAMNEELLHAMSRGGKFLDSKLFRSSGLLAKSLVPIMNFLTDIYSGKMRPLSDYFQDLMCSVRLTVANLNYLHQTRRDVCKLLIKEPGLHKFCNWNCAIGEEYLFPFDMVKKVEEYRKSIKLGVPQRGRYFRGRSSFRGNRFYAKGKGPYRGSTTIYPRSYPQSGQGKESSK